MRFVKLILGVVGVGAVAAVGIAGCGSSTGSTAGTGASGTTGSTTSTGTAEGCAPKASCTAVDKTCLGLVDNTGLTTFGLRMSELDVTSPAALATGIVATTISGGVTPSLTSCNLLGSATFSWLLEFDTTAGTLKTGGASPVTDPTMGYSFDNKMLASGSGMVQVAPITYMVKPDASGNFSITTGQDLIVPIYLDATGASYVLLPLHQARLKMATLSASQNCIGTYNAAGLQTSNSCQPNSGATPPITQFIDGGSLDGYITLKDADGVQISALKESLCVLLSGSATMYGDGANPQLCKKDASGNIIFQGNWCSTTNAAATSTCADSVQLAANFAASSIKINN